MKCCTIKPGDLKYIVAFIAKTQGASDGLGGFTSSFTTIWTGRAKLSFGGLADKVTGAFLGFASSATMTVVKNAPFELADRIEVEGVQYSVTGANPVEPGSRYRLIYLRLWEHEAA